MTAAAAPPPPADDSRRLFKNTRESLFTDMTIEINEGQRFPQQFVNAMVAVGGAALLLAALGLPFAQLGFPVVVVALLAMQVSARYDTRPASGWHFPFAEGFVFLSMLLFEGEVGVILASPRAGWRAAPRA